jgi:hypothetical protein
MLEARRLFSRYGLYKSHVSVHIEQPIASPAQVSKENLPFDLAHHGPRREFKGYAGWAVMAKWP